jgi:hypothetical protein
MLILRQRTCHLGRTDTVRLTEQSGP